MAKAEIYLTDRKYFLDMRGFKLNLASIPGRALKVRPCEGGYNYSSICAATLA